MATISSEKIESFLKKVEVIKKNGGVDLSATEDLSIAVMNLISLEEHFFFTGAKTRDGSYYDLVSEVRDMRKRLMEELVERHEGETWCATKHILAGVMRLIETGNRFQSVGEKEKARRFFDDAYRLYAIFLSLKAKLVDVHTLSSAAKEGTNAGWSLEQLVEKLADCCDEGDTEATRTKNPPPHKATDGRSTEQTRNTNSKA